MQWLASGVPDIVLDVPFQGVTSVGEGRVVGGPDVQLVKVLQEQKKKFPVLQLNQQASAGLIRVM